MLARAFAWILKAVLAFVLLSVVWVFAYLWVPPPVTATMLANGDGIAKTWRGLDAIDPDMARAVIAGEDSKFCAHDGFDRDAIEDAWSRYRKGGRIRGGSTISQQTAKNAFLWQGGGFFRKGLEAWFTFLIEGMWSKRRIMEVYLNIAETGIGTYGAEAGARRYFGHGAGVMTPTEAARIAAVLPLPKARGDRADRVHAPLRQQHSGPHGGRAERRARRLPRDDLGAGRSGRDTRAGPGASARPGGCARGACSTARSAAAA